MSVLETDFLSPSGGAAVNTSCPTHILNDVPTVEDEFGSYIRVAKAILRLLPSELGGKIVALVGDWGSGKSTVIALLENLLQKTNDGTEWAVFRFDAWAHKGDGLRRAFIEELHRFIEQRGWNGEQDLWKHVSDRVKALSAHETTTTTTTRPRLTFAGGLLGLSLLFLPIAERLMHAAESWLQCLGWLLTLSPVLVLVGTYLYWRPSWRFWTKDFWRRIWTKEFWTTHRSPNEINDVGWRQATVARVGVDRPTSPSLQARRR